MEVLKDISDEISFTPDYYAIYRELMSQVSEGLNTTAERVEELEREFLPARVFIHYLSLFCFSYSCLLLIIFQFSKPDLESGNTFAKKDAPLELDQNFVIRCQHTSLTTLLAIQA